MAAAAAAAASQQAHAPPSSPALTAVRRALGFAALATGSAAAWLTWAKTLDEVDEMVAALEKEEKGEEALPIASEKTAVTADATSPSSPSLAARLLLPPLRYYRDKRAAASSTIASYADPPTDRLLPDLPRNAAHVRTLVLDLDGVLVQSDWRRGRGWRTFKRPGVDAFLQAASQYYELVLYTDHLPTYADPILDRLDPRRLIQYRLYRDSTRYVPSAAGGAGSGPQHARDLASLNRDPRRVLFVTASKEAAQGPSARENAVLVPEWGDKMDPADTGLLDLLPFLEALFRTDVPDVRPVVESYGGEPVGPAFRRRMMELEARKKGAGRRGGASGGTGGGQGRFAFFRN
jgi:mitochondrial import inner membrane translocase subunit TIM50